MAQDRRAVGARRRRRRRDLLPPLVDGGPARGARHGAFGGHRRIDPGPQQTARNTTFILTVAALAVLVFFTGYLLQLNIGLQ